MINIHHVICVPTDCRTATFLIVFSHCQLFTSLTIFLELSDILARLKRFQNLQFEGVLKQI